MMRIEYKKGDRAFLTNVGTMDPIECKIIGPSKNSAYDYIIEISEEGYEIIYLECGVHDLVPDLSYARWERKSVDYGLPLAP